MLGRRVAGGSGERGGRSPSFDRDSFSYGAGGGGGNSAMKSTRGAPSTPIGGGWDGGGIGLQSANRYPGSRSAITPRSAARPPTASLMYNRSGNVGAESASRGQLSARAGALDVLGGGADTTGTPYGIGGSAIDDRDDYQQSGRGYLTTDAAHGTSSMRFGSTNVVTDSALDRDDPFDKLESNLLYWVCVSGFSPDAASETEVQNFFQRFDMEESVRGPGNWLFIRFSSTKNASDAEKLDGSLLNGYMLSIRRLNREMAVKLNLRLNSTTGVPSFDEVPSYNRTLIGKHAAAYRTNTSSAPPNANIFAANKRVEPPPIGCLLIGATVLISLLLSVFWGFFIAKPSLMSLSVDPFKGESVFKAQEFGLPMFSSNFVVTTRADARGMGTSSSSSSSSSTGVAPSNAGAKNIAMRVNYNVTVRDLRCDFAYLDIMKGVGSDEFITSLSMHGVHSQHALHSIKVLPVDKKGKVRHYPVDRLPIGSAVDTHFNMDKLSENGIQTTWLTAQNFERTIAEPGYVFVNFCDQNLEACKAFAPTWEALAESMSKMSESSAQSSQQHTGEDLKRRGGVKITSIDCHQSVSLCMSLGIKVFPTLRMYRDGQAQKPDYFSDRTLAHLQRYIEQKRKEDSDFDRLDAVERSTYLQGREEMSEDLPGCQLAGYFIAQSSSFEFRIVGRTSKHFHLNPNALDTSHVINHLSFGPALTDEIKWRIHKVPPPIFDPHSIQKLDQTSYSAKKSKDKNSFLHNIYIASVELVDKGLLGKSTMMSKSSLNLYQMDSNSEEKLKPVPEVRFRLQMSTVGTTIALKSKAMIDVEGPFLIAGVVTCVVMLASIAFGASKWLNDFFGLS